MKDIYRSAQPLFFLCSCSKKEDEECVLNDKSKNNVDKEIAQRGLEANDRAEQQFSMGTLKNSFERQK